MVIYLYFAHLLTLKDVEPWILKDVFLIQEILKDCIIFWFYFASDHECKTAGPIRQPNPVYPTVTMNSTVANFFFSNIFLSSSNHFPKKKKREKESDISFPFFEKETRRTIIISIIIIIPFITLGQRMGHLPIFSKHVCHLAILFYLIPFLP